MLIQELQFAHWGRKFLSQCCWFLTISATPLLMGSVPSGLVTPYLPSPAKGVTAVGDTLYVAAGAQGLIVLDASNPNRPVPVGRCNTQGEAWGVAVSGAHAFVANGTAGLAVVDISQPNSPRLIGSLDTPGDVISVAAGNGYAYVADNWIGFRVIDISQPEQPFSLTVYSNQIIRSVAVAENHAYVLDNEFALKVFDVSEPAHPEPVGTYSFFKAGFGKGLALSGNNAYLALDYAGLAILDFSNPAHPEWVGGCETPGFATGVTVANGFAYLACGWAGVQVIDVADVTKPRVVGMFETTGAALATVVIGSYVCVADDWAGLQVFDVSEPDNPAWVSAYHTAIEPKGVTLSTNAVYLADGAGGLRIFSLEDSLQPLGHYQTDGEAKGLAVSGSYAYVAEGIDGLTVVDASDPAQIEFVANIETGGEANGVMVLSNYLYVANGPAGLAIYNIEEPTEPLWLGSLKMGGCAHSMALSESHAYVANGKKGIFIVDISNPARPLLVGNYDTDGDAQGVALSGNYVYVADGWAGLEVIDITDGTKPFKAGSYATGGFALRVGIQEHKAFVATSFGLKVLNISRPTSPQEISNHTGVEALDMAFGQGKVLVATRSEPVVVLDVGDSAPRIHAFLSKDGHVGLQVSGPAGINACLQYSKNLTDWVDWQILALAQGSTNLFETNCIGEACRFYRSRPTTLPEAGTNTIPQIILDSDLGVDGDDIGDLVLLHKLADLGLCNIVATMYGTSIPAGAPALEAINISCGRPNIPIGATRNPYAMMADYYDLYLMENYPHTLQSGNDVPDAVRLYRELLAAAAPHSITIIEAAYIVTLVDLIRSGPDDISPLTGEELLNQKVRLLAIAAGDYPSGTEVYFRNLPLNSAMVVNRLKCPMLFSGDTLGNYSYTAHVRQLDQLLPTNSILRCGYEHFYLINPTPRRQTWAQNLIYYVLNGPLAAGQKLYEVERGGYNFVDASGGNTWRTDAIKDHGYLVPVARDDDITAAITSLMYLPPGILPLPYDPHVNLFAQLVASNNGTVSTATLEALDVYVKSLKKDGTWNGKKIIWPCVGNDINAALCLLKFKWGQTSGILELVGTAPRAFIEAEGLVGNGEFRLNTGHNAFALGIRGDTCHMAVYSRSNVAGKLAVDCGVYEGMESALSLSLNYSPAYLFPFFDSCSVTSGRIMASQMYPTTGYFIGNRVALNDSRLYRNQVFIASGQTNGGTPPYGPLQIFSYGGSHTRRTLSHFSCGLGLNATQLVTDRTAVQELQAVLGRKVD